MNLFHFSDDPDIRLFKPRPLRVPVDRGPARDWLNGPLVWAIDGVHSFLYLFPRECPRILIWPTPHTSAADRNAWLGSDGTRAVAYVEEGWLDRIRSATLYRYRLPAMGFDSIDELGMWVSRGTVMPAGCDAVHDLPARLAVEGVELRSLARLTPLKSLWDTTLHASGIRLRNALDWGPPGWNHSAPSFPPDKS
ncbi:hypothetical protein BLA6993_04007 [Burkholderia lata]|uniref:DUF6886 family protein n=1 Tax=Burkholderia lata (strain ATCC 17760 / DSM 23089 / LMG 22485 / NCIMB 9086 / R18194 / 383) TaxID=482957 RepID=UPI001452F66F|nr:DUF6886 family protein [Burkholderia lata]VWB84331.1 hypothetical protein BLA6993_04007 [Burkholderia lata]